MFTIIAIAVVVLPSAVLAYAASKPDTLRVTRTIAINVPPEKIFPLINDFRRWGSWSAYEQKDPAMKRTYGGAPEGKGAVYEWEGNRNVGTGRMELTESARPSRITIKLDFMKPFEGHNIAEFLMEPRGDSTKVTWSMYGPNRYIGKVMSVFIDMDNMIGKDFEAGLAKLKTIAET